MDETPEDNWETVRLINRMGSLESNGRPAEFTVTPMQNVPLGRIRSKSLNHEMLDASQLAVYYACYFHLMKITRRNALKDSKGNLLRRTLVATSLSLGSWRLFGLIEGICKKRGVDVEKVRRYGLEQPETVRVIAR